MVCSKLVSGAASIAFVLLSGCTDQVQPRMSYDEYLEQFNKSYANASEKAEHEKIFNEAMDLIEDENRKGNGFTMGVTPFTDVDTSAFNSQYLLLTAPNDENVTLFTPTRASVPDEVDWVKDGAVSSVKDQNPCGTCWSFAAAGAIEGARAIFGDKKLVSLSNQEFQDCTGNGGYFSDIGHSCSGQDAGGHPVNAFKYAIANGVASYQSYPFNPRLGTHKETCQSPSRSLAGHVITGYYKVNADEESLKEALASQPVAVALNAQYSGPIQHYTGGIISSRCSTALDHAVLAVGYGTERNGYFSSTDYWLIKNSWGSRWGENGYFRLVRGANECGVLKDGWYVTLK